MGDISTGRNVRLVGFGGLLFATVLIGTPHCQQPTEVTLAITTNVPCAQLQGVTITVGPASEVETMPPGTQTQACSTSGNVGTIVVVPSGDKSSAVDIKVVGGVNRDPSTCVAPSYGTGCIVARRSLEFIPHTPLVLDVMLSQDCNGVACAADETCTNGACTSSQVQDPSSCTKAGSCGQDALAATTAPPQPPSPLVCGDTTGLQSGAAWPMMGNCPTHVGRSASVSAKTNHVRWTAATGGKVSSGIAIAADGTIYAGASDGKLYAVSASGDIKWSTLAGTSAYLNAVPAIAQDGTVYIGNQDESLYAVSSAGTLSWNYKIGGELFTSANVGGDGTIYVGGSGGDSSAYALNNNGTLKWSFKSGGDMNASPAIGFDGTVYVGSEDSNMYALAPTTGDKTWAYADGEGGAQTPVVGTDGTVYFNGKSSMCGVDIHGKLAWVTSMTNQAIIPAIGWDGTVYAGSTDGGFYAFDGAKGTVKWHLTGLGAFDWATQPTIGGDGTIYVGATNGVFYAFTPSGSTLWTLTTGGAIHGPAAIGADGTLYFGSDNQKLYALGP
jgi:outer membrane protein assembly factor BamB